MLWPLLDLLHTAFANIMIALTLFWMIFWDSEASSPFGRHFIPKIRRPFVWLGLTGKWRMFSPNPPRQDVWPMAVLTMADGSVLYWEPKPYADTSILEKIRFKKVLKFYQQVTAQRATNQIKRDFVEYVLRRDRSGKTCTTIEVFRITRDVPPFGSNDPSPQKTCQESIFVFHPNPPK